MEDRTMVTMIALSLLVAGCIAVMAVVPKAGEEQEGLKLRQFVVCTEVYERTTTGPLELDLVEAVDLDDLARRLQLKDGTDAEDVRFDLTLCQVSDQSLGSLHKPAAT